MTTTMLAAARALARYDAMVARNVQSADAWDAICDRLNDAVRWMAAAQQHSRAEKIADRAIDAMWRAFRCRSRAS